MMKSVTTLASLFLCLLSVTMGVQAQWFVQGSAAYVMLPAQDTTVTRGYDVDNVPILERYQDHSQMMTPEFSLGFGYRINFHPNYQAGLFARNEISINYLYQPSLTLSGTASSVDTSHVDQTYQYRIDNHAYMIEDRFYVNTPSLLRPFILAGVGIAKLSASDFNSDPADATAPIFSEPYANNNINHLVVEMGVGMAIDWSKQLSLSLAYRYLDFGKIETGQAPNAVPEGEPTADGLHYSLVSQALMLGVHYYF